MKKFKYLQQSNFKCEKTKTICYNYGYNIVINYW